MPEFENIFERTITDAIIEYSTHYKTYHCPFDYIEGYLGAELGVCFDTKMRSKANSIWHEMINDGLYGEDE